MRGCALQLNSTGATTTMPSASPAHQLARACATARLPSAPVARRAPTPTSAATIAPEGIATSRSVRAWRGSSSWGREPATRRSRYAASSASSVLPAAMPIAAASGTGVLALTANAPIATPGQ